MATVNFTIGTIFKSEGFKKCQQGIKTLNGHIKQAAGITAQMAGVMGMMDSKAGNAAAAVSGLMSAFASGNPILVAVQVGMLAVSRIVGELQKAEEEAKAEADKLNESLKRLFETQQRIREEKLNDYLKSVTDEAKRLGDEFDRITRKANAMTDILSKIDKSKDAGKLLQMRIDAFNHQQTGSSDDMGVVKAQDELKIQLEKNNQALKRRQEILDKASKDIEDNFAREKSIRERINVINNGLIDLREEESKISTADLEGRKKITDKIKKLEEERTSLIKEFKDSQSKEILLQQAKLQAEEDYKNQVLENKLSEMQANKAIVDAENERAETIRKRNQEEAERKTKQKEVEEKIIKELEKQLSDAEQKSKEATNNFDKAVGDYRDARMAFGSDNRNLINQMLGNMDRSALGNLRNSGNLQNGLVSLPDENGNPQIMNYQDAAAQMAVERGLKDGSIRSMRDMEQVRKNAKRAARDQASSNDTLQETRDDRELARLEKMNPKAMSQRDKQRLKDLNELKEAKDKAGREADAKLKKVEEAQKVKEKADNAVIEIKDLLKDKLGLK